MQKMWDCAQEYVFEFVYVCVCICACMFTCACVSTLLKAADGL